MALRSPVKAFWATEESIRSSRISSRSRTSWAASEDSSLSLSRAALTYREAVLIPTPSSSAICW